VPTDFGAFWFWRFGIRCTLTEQNNSGCRACRSPKTRLLFRIQENSVRNCLECTHVYLDAVHDLESILNQYKNYGQDGQSQYFAGIDANVVRNLDTYLKRCKQFLACPGSSLNLLDIGCGNGALLGRAKHLGFLCVGIEICSGLARQVRSQLDCQVHEQFFRDLRISDSRFEVVTMYDLLEHLGDPISDVKEVFRILKPGGVFFVLTPNDGALLRRISRMIYRLSFHSFDEPMRRLYYPDHLSYFTAQSLSDLLRRVGFELVSLESVNQELSRLELSTLEKLAVKAIHQADRPFRYSGGKLLAYARKPYGMC
jgi:2-polyprenyl-3-methyl-5-hydroxy-6-metoxy-1,4-benzoquinol methylase